MVKSFFIVFTSAIQIQGFKHCARCALKLRDIQFKIGDAQLKIESFVIGQNKEENDFHWLFTTVDYQHE